MKWWWLWSEIKKWLWWGCELLWICYKCYGPLLRRNSIQSLFWITGKVPYQNLIWRVWWMLKLAIRANFIWPNRGETTQNTTFMWKFALVSFFLSHSNLGRLELFGWSEILKDPKQSKTFCHDQDALQKLPLSFMSSNNYSHPLLHILHTVSRLHHT